MSKRINNKEDNQFKKCLHFLKIGKYNEALRCYDQVVKLNPDNEKAWFGKGLALASLGKHEEALTCYDQAIKLNPGDENAWFSKALSLSILEKYEEALKCFDAVIKLNPDNEETWFNKGLALVKLEKHNEVLKCFDEVIKLNAKHEKAWFYKGLSLSILGKHDKALRCYDQVVKLNPNSEKAWFSKAVALASLGKQEEALACYDQVVKLKPDNEKAWINKVIILVNLGRYNEAIKCCDEVIKLNPGDEKTWFDKGLALSSLGKQEQALTCYDQAIKLNPGDEKAWLGKGLSLSILRKYNEALKCFDEVIKLNPDNEKAWFNKGLALASLGKHEETLTCYYKAIKLNPGYEKVWFYKGLSLSILRKYNEALKCFDEAIKLNPKYEIAWIANGDALHHLKKYEQAIKSYEKASEINPKNEKAWYNKGNAIAALGKYDEAINCYDNAIEINPKLDVAYGNLGLAFLNMHRFDEASKMLNEAKKIFLEKKQKENAKKANKFLILAKNSSELISRLNKLDDIFKETLKSKRLTELKEKSINVSETMNNIIKDFKEKEIADDVKELLKSKAVCFNVLSESLKFKKVDLKKLRNTKDIFEKWKLDDMVIAASSLENFILNLKRYRSLKDIPIKAEKPLIQLLQISQVLDGKLTEEISDKIKGDDYYPTKQATIKIEKEPELIDTSIEITKKGWVKFCLVQLDFTLKYQLPPKEYGWILKDKDKIKSKVLKALTIANKNKVNIICFPELSFAKEWIEEIKNKYKGMIIIGGSYYEKAYNITPILLDGMAINPPYKKCCPSPSENPITTERGMKCGNRIYIFRTKYGEFSVLTCMDYSDQSRRVCKHGKIDFIINPCYDKNIARFQPQCNSDCSNFDIAIIQVNKAPENGSFGKTCIIAKEHIDILNKLKDDGFKPVDDIKYKLFELEGEMMIIVDFNIKMKPTVSLPLDYTGRIKVSKKNLYKYQNEKWTALAH